VEFIAHKVNTNYFSLAMACPSIDIDKVAKKFATGLLPSSDENEKGYGNIQVGFLSEKGTEFYIYTRYDVSRVGALYENHKEAGFLVDWLVKQNCTLDG